MTDLNDKIDVLAAQQTPEQSEELKLKLLRWAISSMQGWQNLAKIIKTSPNPTETRDNCVSLLKKLAGDHEVDLPAVPVQDGQSGQDSADTSVEMMKIKFADLLEQQLDQRIRELDQEKE